MTFGSCDLSRIARPGRLGAPRFGLLRLVGALVTPALGAFALSAMVLTGSGCVDQTLIPVEKSQTTGGGSNVGAGGSSGFGSGAGGYGQYGGSVGFGGQSTNCNGASCCKDSFDACQQNVECCSGLCNAGYCAAPSENICLVADYYTRCNVNPGNCCSGKCETYNGGSNRVCQAVEGCKPKGESCVNWWECCSDNCSAKPGGVGRCVYEPDTACRKPGDRCYAENAQDVCCADSTCKRTPEGVLRCKRRSGAGCADPNEACRVASDCCAITPETTGHCIISSSDQRPSFNPDGNYGTCQACGDAGQFCKVDADCCVDQGYECQLNGPMVMGTCVLKASQAAGAP